MIGDDDPAELFFCVLLAAVALLAVVLLWAGPPRQPAGPRVTCEVCGHVHACAPGPTPKEARP